MGWDGRGRGTGSDLDEIGWYARYRIGMRILGG